MSTAPSIGVAAPPDRGWALGDPMLTKPKRQNARLMPHVGALTDFSTVLIVLAELSPERVTAAQLAFFLSAAIADIGGRPATFTELRDAVGPAIGKSLHTTYQVFLDRERTRGDGIPVAPGVGWLERETNPTDQRQKFLRLTAKGREVIKEVVEAMEGSRQ